jgi:putative flippase GtrA
VLVATVQGLHLSPVTGSGLGFVLSAGVNYWLNRRFTFRSDAPHAGVAFRFAVIVIAGLLINLALMHVLSGTLAWPYLLAQVLTTGVVLVWNFSGNAFWTFRGGVAGGKMPQGE